MNKHRIFILLLALILILTSVITISCECGTAFTLILENETDRILVTYYSDNIEPLGEIKPGEQLSMKQDKNLGYYEFTFKSIEGITLFSEQYTFTTNLEKINNRTYKATIPPTYNTDTSESDTPQE